MSKHNYNKYSRPIKSDPEPDVAVEPVEIDLGIEEETAPEVAEAKSLIGKVSGCRRLNIRQEATTDSGILGVLEEGSEVMILHRETENEFYKICTASGIEGYCMVLYIEIQ